MEKKRQGFALIEMLAVMALILILGTVTVVQVARYRRPLKLTEMDETAKEIFLAAQDRMASARVQRLMDRAGDDALVATLLDTGTEDAAYYGKKLGDGTYLASRVNGVAGFLLPEGSIDGTVQGQQYVIRYDRDSYKILDVVYTDEDRASFPLWTYLDGLDDAGFSSFLSQIKASVKARMEFSDSDRGYDGVYTVGWYGEGTAAADIAAHESENYLSLTVDLNGGSYKGLRGPFTVRVPRMSDADRNKGLDAWIAQALKETGGGYETAELTNGTQGFKSWTFDPPEADDGTGGTVMIDTGTTIGSIMGVGALTATAQWNMTGTTTYTVTYYKTKGGTTYRICTANLGDPVPLAPTPSRTGHTFDKWVNSAGDAPFDFLGAIVTKDLDLYATWELVPYQIAYDLDGGASDGSYPTSYTVDSSGIRLSDPTKTGHTFDHWTKSDGTPTIVTVSSGGSVEAVTPSEDPGKDHADLWFKAIWTVNKYTITWLNGDGNVLQKDEKDYGDMPSYSGVEPTKATPDGGRTTYEFNGAWSPTIVAVTSDATYTAQFDTKYKVTFHANGGKFGSGDSASDTSYMFVKHGEKATAPSSAPTRDGYDFKGWYPKDSDTQYDFDTTVTGPVDLYAKWELATLTIHFELGGGTITSDGIVYNKVDDIKVRKDNENTLDSFLPVGEPTHSAYTLKDPASPWKFHQGAKNGALIDGSTPVKDVPDTVTDIWAVVQWAKPVQKVTVKVMRQNTTQTGYNADHSVTITSEQLADAELGIGTSLNPENVQKILELATPSLNNAGTMTGRDNYTVPKYSHFTYTNLTGDSGTLTDLDAGDAEICLYYTRDTIKFHFYDWKTGTTNMDPGSSGWILVTDKSGRFDYMDRAFKVQTSNGYDSQLIHFADLNWGNINLRRDITWISDVIQEGQPDNESFKVKYITASIQGDKLIALLGQSKIYQYRDRRATQTTSVTIQQSGTYYIRIWVSAMSSGVGKGFALVRTGTSKKWGFHLFDISSGNLEAKWTEYKTIEGLYGATFADAGYTSWDAVTDGKGYADQDGYPVNLTGFFDADVIDENDSNEFSFYHFTGQVN